MDFKKNQPAFLDTPKTNYLILSYGLKPVGEIHGSFVLAASKSPLPFSQMQMV